MKLSKKDIDEFKEIYFQEFGEEISDAEAEKRGNELLTLMSICLKKD